MPPKSGKKVAAFPQGFYLSTMLYRITLTWSSQVRRRIQEAREEP
jgi:hypothetical protein